METVDFDDMTDSCFGVERHTHTPVAVPFVAFVTFVVCTIHVYDFDDKSRSMIKSVDGLFEQLQ